MLLVLNDIQRSLLCQFSLDSTRGDFHIGDNVDLKLVHHLLNFLLVLKLFFELKILLFDLLSNGKLHWLYLLNLCVHLSLVGHFVPHYCASLRFETFLLFHLLLRLLESKLFLLSLYQCVSCLYLRFLNVFQHLWFYFLKLMHAMLDCVQLLIGIELAAICNSIHSIPWLLRFFIVQDEQIDRWFMLLDRTQIQVLEAFRFRRSFFFIGFRFDEVYGGLRSEHRYF